MKRNFFAILTAAALAFAAPVAAQQASVFGTAGLGAGTGSAFSSSETDSVSRTESWGNGEASHSAFTGATNTSRVGVGFQQGSMTEGTVTTFTSGETFSQVEGSKAGGAFAGGSGFADQRGNAFGQTSVFAAGAFGSVGATFGKNK